MATTETLDTDETQTPAREQLQRAFNRFSELVHRVPADAWDRPSPCEGWTVRDVLAHMTAEHLWAPRLLAGETIEQVGDEYDGDVLGDDPVAAWDSAASGSREAWANTEDGTTVHLSFGDTPAGEYAEQVLLDLTVHAWDLGTGAGLDVQAGVVPEAVLHVLRYAKASGMVGQAPFGPEVQTTSEDPQVQLAALLGRTPA